ncbi:MAG: Vps62-related protein [Actinomycetia bacterium]|nr:Vps62-related protein [Actinomycetes bacterium]MCP4084043.1 Vps62-related protein [Actinomycetes bacterium]
MSKSRRRSAITVMLVVLVFAGLMSVFPDAARAEDLAGDDPGGAQQLADRYAPVMVLKAQDGPCDPEGEPYAPTNVEIVLDNPEILLRQVGNGDPAVKRAPSASDLFGLGQGFFLDFPGGALDPGCIYERDFARYRAGLPVTVYAHIAQNDAHPGRLVLQYWFYWYYNDWNNKHESDWEGVQLLFDASSIEQALAGEPVSVGYAQHEGGERAHWDSSKLERDGTHPVVYSSAGSHASYYGSAVYLGRSGSEGFGCDNTDGPSDRFESEVIVLPDTVDDAASELAWLAYEGRWGERQRGAFNGPTGPLAKGRWLDPVTWHDELRQSSVVIPAGDSIGEQVIGAFCSTVEWGSSQLISVTTSPIRLMVIAVLLGLMAIWLIRRTTWTLAPATPLVDRRRAGQIIRGAYRQYRRSWRDLLPFGAVYLPAILVAGLLGALFSLLPLVGDLLDVAGDRSGTSFILAVTAGGVPQVIAAVAVNAAAAAYLGSSSSDERCSAAGAIRLCWSAKGRLVRATLRALVVVGVLLVSIVGIPWGIRQLVRYQFAPQVIVLEGLDSRAALARSTELVRGRWLHTAVMVAVFNALPLVTALIIGLLLLLALAGLPLWVFSVLMTLIYGLLMPLAATAHAMLYGDAVADNDQHQDEVSSLEAVGTH